MFEERHLLFERRVSGEEAVVMQNIFNFDGLYHPTIEKILTENDFSIPELVRLLRLDFDRAGNAQHRQFFHDDGLLAGDIIFRLTETPIGLVEVSDIVLLPGPLKFHRQPAASDRRVRGFHAVYGLMGEANLVLPQRPSSDPDFDLQSVSINLQQGGLAVIGSATASHWGPIEKGFEFRYVAPAQT